MAIRLEINLLALPMTASIYDDSSLLKHQLIAEPTSTLDNALSSSSDCVFEVIKTKRFVTKAIDLFEAERVTIKENK